MKLNDNVKIIIRGYLEYEQIKSLTLLYSPIIGSEACFFYLGLYHLIDMQKGASKEYKVSFFINLFSISQKTLKELREKLEAISLIKTYYSPSKKCGDNYIIKLKVPKGARDFKKDSILLANLATNLKENTLDDVFETFHLDYQDLENYRNISKKYSDLYKTDTSILKNIYLKNNFRGLEKPSEVKIDYELDIDKFISFIPRSILLKNDKMHDENYLKNLKNISFIYKLNEEELSDIYINIASRNQNKVPTISDISNKASAYFIKKEEKNRPEKVIKSEYDVETFNSLSPSDLVLTFNTDATLSSLELQNCEQFYSNNIDTERGVLASVVIFVNKRLNNIPHKNYLQKVLNSWQSEYGITNTESAISYLTDYDKVIAGSKKIKKADQERVSKKYGPDWIEKAKEELKEMKEQQEFFKEQSKSRR